MNMVKEGKIKVKFAGGEASDGIHECNFVMGRYTDTDGHEHKLYEVVRTPDDWDGYDNESYPHLKKEIIRQAGAAGINDDRLVFSE